MKPLHIPLSGARPAIVAGNDVSDDHTLMAAAGRGDAQAYKMLVERHLGRAVGFARKMLGNKSDAEDIAQEAFLKVWNEAPRWQPKAQFTTWFYRVMYNLCIDHTRKHKAVHVEIDETIADSDDSVEKALIDASEVKRVQAAIQQLPERQRAAIVLFYYEELSQSETAHTLGITESALETLLFRARQTLKLELNVMN